MTLFSTTSVKQIATTQPNVHAFDVIGHVSSDDAEAMAEHMNVVFDVQDKVNMLLRLNDYSGSDRLAMFDGDVIESRWRSLANVERYAVVGAPAAAATMIAVMDKLIPVDARAFDAENEANAWVFVGATEA